MSTIIGIIIVLFVLGLIINILKWIWKNIVNIILILLGLGVLIVGIGIVIAFPKTLILIAIWLFLLLITKTHRMKKKKAKLYNLINEFSMCELQELSEKSKVKQNLILRLANELEKEEKIVVYKYDIETYNSNTKKTDTIHYEIYTHKNYVEKTENHFVGLTNSVKVGTAHQIIPREIQEKYRGKLFYEKYINIYFGILNDLVKKNKIKKYTVSGDSDLYYSINFVTEKENYFMQQLNALQIITLKELMSSEEKSRFESKMKNHYNNLLTSILKNMEKRNLICIPANELFAINDFHKVKQEYFKSKICQYEMFTLEEIMSKEDLSRFSESKIKAIYLNLLRGILISSLDEQFDLIENDARNTLFVLKSKFNEIIRRVESVVKKYKFTSLDELVYHNIFNIPRKEQYRSKILQRALENVSAYNKSVKVYTVTKNSSIYVWEAELKNQLQLIKNKLRNLGAGTIEQLSNIEGLLQSTKILVYALLESNLEKEMNGSEMEVIDLPKLNSKLFKMVALNGMEANIISHEIVL